MRLFNIDTELTLGNKIFGSLIVTDKGNERDIHKGIYEPIHVTNASLAAPYWSQKYSKC